MSTRLAPDTSILGYWGFDEANVADPAVDESIHVNDLVVFNAAGVVPARIGNGRQFDGVATYAAPADSTIFRVGIQSAIVWFVLDSVNQAGDLLRPVVTLEGPGGGAADATDLGIHVDNAGALVLHLTASGNLPVVLKTAPGAIRVNRYYSVAVTVDTARAPPDGNYGIIAKLWLNDVATPWASLTVNGVPQVDPNAEGPVRAACGNATILTVGGRQKSVSKWHGVVDELSLHSAVRAHDPYLRAAYFRLTLAATFARLTMQGTVKVLAAADMGGGTRWWCYERDQSVYVIRENSLGLFSAEVQLTEGPMLANGAKSPGGVGTPRLAYDAASDTLVVAFLGAGRVFKVTALSSDAPVTLVMPATGETLGGAIKFVDPVDVVRNSVRDALPAVAGAASITPTNNHSPAVVAFLHVPTFGVAVEGTNAAGYVLVRRAGDVETIIGYAVGAKQVTRPAAAGNYWFLPIADRVDGASYLAYPLGGMGALVARQSNLIVDRLGALVGNADLPATWSPDALVWSRHGDALHEHAQGSAGQAFQRPEAFVFASLYPVKMSLVEGFQQGTGGSTDILRNGIVSAYPVKHADREDILGSSGGGTRLTMTLATTRRVDL